MPTLAQHTFRIDNVILSYPHLFEKQSPPGVNATPAYSAEFIVDPASNPQAFAAMEEAFRKVVLESGKGDQLAFLTRPWRDRGGVQP